MKKTLIALLICIPCVNNTYGKLYVTTDNVKVRKTKGAHISSLGVIKKGTIVDVNGNDGQWGTVEYNHKQGYIKIANLRLAAAAPKSTLPEESPAKEEAPADSSGLVWLGVFAGVTLAVAFLVRRFKEAGKSGLTRATGTGAMVKTDTHHHHHSAAIFWYQCQHCSAIVKKNNEPSHSGCLRASIHHWTQLAEVGLSKYSCKQCLATIQSNGVPNNEGCPGGGYHSWMLR